MSTHHIGAPGVSGKAHRDHISRDLDASNKLHNDDTNTNYSVPQPAANTHDISPSYSQDCASIRRQCPWQKIATSPNKPPSRACSSRCEATLDPKQHAADPDPQRDTPTFALGTTLRESSCVCPVCQPKAQSTDSYLSTAPMSGTFHTDNSINNANNPDNRVNNGNIEIGNSSSSASAATITYANDITHFHIGTIQYHVCVSPECLNPGSSPNDLGNGESRDRAQKRQRGKPRSNNRGRTVWEIFWCFY